MAVTDGPASSNGGGVLALSPLDLAIDLVVGVVIFVVVVVVAAVLMALLQAVLPSGSSEEVAPDTDDAAGGGDASSGDGPSPADRALYGEAAGERDGSPQGRDPAAGG